MHTRLCRSSRRPHPSCTILKYDPKDVIIVIGGLIFGPLTSFVITAIISVVQMFTISGTGILGCIMNIISSCSFACTAAFIYKKKHKLSGAMLGLFCGLACQATVMMVWNYLIAPIYMGYPRDVIAGMLIPVFLPFNLIKGGLNTAITMLLYKPVITALRRSNLIETKPDSEKMKINIGVVLLALLMIITCVLLILSYNNVI